MKVSKEVAGFYVGLFEATPSLEVVFSKSITPEISAITKGYVAFQEHETPQADLDAIKVNKSRIADLGKLLDDAFYYTELARVAKSKNGASKIPGLVYDRENANAVMTDLANENVILQEAPLQAFCDAYHKASGSRTASGPRSNIVGCVVECAFGGGKDLNVAVLGETLWHIWDGHEIALQSSDLTETLKVTTLSGARRIATASTGYKGKHVAIDGDNAADSISGAIKDKLYGKVGASGTEGTKIVSEDAQTWEMRMRNQNGETLGKID